MIRLKHKAGSLARDGTPVVPYPARWEKHPCSDAEPRVAAQPRSITEYAMDAKISGDQRKQAMRVADVPAD